MKNSIGIKGMLAAACLAAASCTTVPKIMTDSDPAQDFSTYSTFAWVSEDPMTMVGDHSISPFVRNEITQAIRATLSARGYRFVENLEQADFVVSYMVGARDMTRTTTTIETDYLLANRLNWRWGNEYFYPFSEPFPREKTVSHHYTEGTLSIDIFDAKRRSPVWHARAAKVLTRNDMKEKDTDIASDINTLLAGFPPM